MELVILIPIIAVFVTTGIVIFVTIFLIKKAMRGFLTRVISQIKSNPEFFKDQNIEGSDMSKERIIQILENMGEIKKFKIGKSLDPETKIIDLFTKTPDGQDQQYRASLAIKNHQAKLKDITRSM